MKAIPSPILAHPPSCTECKYFRRPPPERNITHGICEKFTFINNNIGDNDEPARYLSAEAIRIMYCQGNYFETPKPTLDKVEK